MHPLERFETNARRTEADSTLVTSIATPQANEEHLGEDPQRECLSSISRPGCCDDTICPRAALAELLTPEMSMERRVEVLACAVASTCETLSDTDLRYCFSRAFELHAECRFFHVFKGAYRIERETLEGLRSIAAA